MFRNFALQTLKRIHVERELESWDVSRTLKTLSRHSSRYFSAGETPPSKNVASSIPGVVKGLGFGGLIPFWALSPAIASWLPFELFGGTHETGTLQLAYGASILSFLGGVHWGLAMTSHTPLRATTERYVQVYFRYAELLGAGRQY